MRIDPHVEKPITVSEREKLLVALRAGCSDEDAAAYAGVNRRQVADFLISLGESADDVRNAKARMRAAKEIYHAKIAEKAVELVESQLTDALSGEKAADRNAARKDALDRAFGKATENIDVKSGGEKLQRFPFTPEVLTAMRKLDDEVEKQLRENA